MNDMISIDEKRLAVIAAEINMIKEQARATVLTATCEIGKRLLEVKNSLSHGRFAEWLQDNVDCSIRQAQQMMALYEEYGKNDNRRVLESLSVSQAIALLTAPAEVRADMIETGEAEDMSVRELKKEIARRKQEIDDQQVTILQLETEAAQQKDLADKQAARAMEAEDRLKKAEKAAKDADAAGIKATAEKQEFMRRAEHFKMKADDLEKKLSEAQAVEKVVEIEVVPPEVQQELDRLREMERKAPEEAVTKGRGCYDRIQREFNDLFDAIHQMSDGWKEKYRKVCAKGLHMMAEKLEG